jgi:hypothetical protein
VKLSFLEYNYPLLAPSVVWPEYGCRIAGLEDLAAMKLSAIANRGARKDFIDIYALGRGSFSLDGMLGLYRRKFATQDLAHILMSLTYFDDADQEAPPEMLWPLGWDEVKRTAEAWVKAYVRQHTSAAPRRGPVR